MNKLISMVLAMGLLLQAAVTLASEEEDMAEMQRQLNADVMAQPFDADDAARIDAYVRDAMKKDLKPPAAPPVYWQSGWSCADIRYRSYRDYRNCIYYQRYYGRIW